MSYWNMLPVELQERVMRDAVRLMYDTVVKQFNTICVSLDARLMAHDFVRPPNTTRYGSRTSVFCQTRERHHRSYLLGQNSDGTEYTEYETIYTQTFGNKVINNLIWNRGALQHRQHNDPSELPLQCVLANLGRYGSVTIDHVQQLLRLNQIKFKKSARKPELVQLFLKIN